MIEPREVPGPLSQMQCSRIIGEAHQQRLLNCYRIAWGRYSAMDPQFRKDMTATARANVIHCFAVVQAIIEFQGLRNVDIVDNRDSSGYFFLVFQGNVVLRFKKFSDDSFRTSSIVTQRQQEFALQQSPIPGIEETTNLILGYLLDEFETRMDIIAIACSIDDRVQWIWDISQHRKVESGTPEITERHTGPSRPRISSAGDVSHLRPVSESDDESSEDVDDEHHQTD